MTEELRFRSICQANGLLLDDETVGKLSSFVGLLSGWNTKINLVSRLDAQNLWLTHLLHCVSLLFFVKIPQSARVLDLGTGGGLPGIPLAIIRPDLDITLLDSIKKKTMVVEDIIDKLLLKNTRVLTGRAEQLGVRNDLSGRFDIVTARAVAPLHELLKWSRPFLKTRTSDDMNNTLPEPPYLIAMKGGDLKEEIRTATIKTNLKYHTIIDLVFKGSDELNLQDKKLVIAY